MPKLSPIVDFLVRDARTRVHIVYPWERPSMMRKHIVTGAMGTVYFILLSGIYLVAFGNRIGLQHWQWGLLSSLSSLVLGLQLYSAYLVRRTGYRRSIWFLAALAARCLRGSAIVAAFLLAGKSGPAARLVFIVLLVAANCFDAIAAPPWMSWLADIIPREGHGRFMGRRSAWIALANLLVVVPIGFAVDRLGDGSGNAALLGVFAFGFALGILDLFIHRTIPEPVLQRTRDGSFLDELAAPLRDRAFRPWLIFNGLWTFSMTLGGALATIYFVEDLGIKKNFLGGSVALIVLPLAATVISARLAGKMIDRKGFKPVLKLGHALWATLPLFWIMATPRTALLWLGAAAVIAGMGSSAAMNAASKLLTRMREPGHVPMYVALSTCVGCLGGALGPLVGSLVLHAMGDTKFVVAGMEMGGFHVLFMASFVLRMASTLAIRSIPAAPGAEA